MNMEPTIIKSGRSTLLLFAAAILLGFISVLLFYENNPGLNVPIFAVAIIATVIFIARSETRTIVKSEYILLTLAFLFSTMVFVRESPLLSFFNIVGSFLLFLLVAVSFTGKKISWYALEDFVKVVFTPLFFLKPFFDAIASLPIFTGKSRDDVKRKEIIRGVVFAGIVVVVFSFLFASADLVFRGFVENIFSFEIDPTLIQRGIMWAFVGAFFLGAFGYAFRTTNLENGEGKGGLNRFFGALEMKIVLGSMAVLFLGFIILQLTYLFGGESQLLSSGFTYAEYARRGFFELVLVAVLSALIILFTERCVVQKESQHLDSFKLLSGGIVLLVVLILASAFFRLSLYEAAYGFSTIRLYSYAFMIWIGVALVLLASHIFSGDKPQKFAIRVFASVVLLLFVMNVINPDAFIARQNIARFEETGKLDMSYLVSLSNDALPVTIQLLKHTDPLVRESFKSHLSCKLFWQNQYSSKWPETTLSGLKANMLLTPIAPKEESCLGLSWSEVDII